MSRREELESELEKTRQIVDNAPRDMPKALLDAYRQQLDSISFELNTLYDDYESESE